MKPVPSHPALLRAFFGALVGASAAVALPGCSIFSRPASDSAQYYLEAVPESASESAPAPGPDATAATAILPEISIRRASALPPFDGLPFVYAQADGTWRTDTYAGWIATPGAMVTSALSDHLARTGRFGSVSAAGSFRSDRPELSLVIERLYSDFRGEGPGRAVVRIRWYLVIADATSARDTVLGSGVAEAEAPIAAQDSGAVAQATSAALAAAFDRIVEGIAAAAPKKGG